MPQGIYVSQFTPYLAAKTDAEEAAAVRSILRQIESGRGFNYWQGISNALVTDRAGTRDGQVLFDAVGRAKPERQEAYGLVAEKWAQLAPWFDGGQYEKLPGVRVPLGNLEVRVPKLCGERGADGDLEVLLPRWSQRELPRHVVYGALRIVQLAHPDATSITFLDVPRLAMYSSLDQDLTAYDSWLLQAGDDLAKRLPDVEDQAQAA
jgi:hypothetical protein